MEEGSNYSGMNSINKFIWDVQWDYAYQMVRNNVSSLIISTYWQYTNSKEEVWIDIQDSMWEVVEVIRLKEE